MAKEKLDHEYYEKARKRVKQKRRLYFHFVFFLVGSVFFVLLNKVVKFKPELDWYLWAILAWCVILLIHFINVFVMNPFFGKEWERKETEKLIAKHQVKLEKLEGKLEKDGVFDPMSEHTKS